MSSRREFLAAFAAVGTGFAGVARTATTTTENVSIVAHKLAGYDQEWPEDWSRIRGFNYQPSNGMNGLEIWTRFDPDIVATELNRGKRYFPNMNAVRIWLSWEAFRIDQKKFAADFEIFLKLLEEHSCHAMPVLFNRWRGFPDFGGIYMDHFMPGSLARRSNEKVIAAYIETIIGEHSSDPRIFAWDLCNEPYFNKAALGQADDTPTEATDAETTWLRSIYRSVKSYRPLQPVTIAAHGEHPLSRMNEFSDVLTIHPYWSPGYPGFSLEKFNATLDEHVIYANKVGKPLLATECCSGSENDEEHVEIIRGTLEALKVRGIGWMPHLLHHSMVADAHRPKYGAYSGLYMAFIEADGSLRAGHEIFNQF